MDVAIKKEHKDIEVNSLFQPPATQAAFAAPAELTKKIPKKPTDAIHATAAQLKILKASLEKKKYPDKKDREAISAETGLYVEFY